ncbi:uncharacterized protein DUF397 [Herbihabitans rhizosphaerae]|uniref:Uncharacterized protein DUF397 n=1 Tax=Herbihabitans rhizosphaerae TaxID=1872711 RepID=A0A4Q7KGU9_9PSEU|nr:DUF397 domain-containing protein [Herbihabitans rhizosphaerae]RZS34483.1 uncharacterized protein DUF397 [Herbihabitans rhizosphaerae]
MNLGVLTWRKSTRSGHETDCVELAWPTDATALRDSKNPGPAVVVTRSGFAGLLTTVRGATP